MVVLEANLDDTTGEEVGHAIARLLAAGALDAFATPITMKKGRPGVVLTVLAEPGNACQLRGDPVWRDDDVRRTATCCERRKLARRFETVTYAVR